MPNRRTLRWTIALVLLVGFGVSPAFAQASLGQARDLYQSADYEQSLAVLDQLDGSGSGDLTEIGTYKVFCLLALNRNDEAVKAIDAVVTADPFYQPPESLASPRVRSVFRDARRALLPSLVQRDYAMAKAAFDRKDPNATALFEQVLRLLSDPDATGQAGADLRVLAEGFRDLSRTFTAPQQLASAASQGEGELPTRHSADGGPQPAVAAPAQQPTRSPSRTPEATPAVVANRPASSDDRGVIPPVALAQPLPRWSPPPVSSLNANRVLEGVLEIFIDEHGAVTDVRLKSTFHPQYDAELLKMARSWRFQPATRNGTPIPFVKVMQIRLTPSTP
jgi:TonB family protein